MKRIIHLFRKNIYLFLGQVDRLLKRKSTLFVLCYHAVAKDKWLHSINPKVFEQQMNYLKQSGYEFITIKNLYDHLLNKKKITRPSVLITFDDGYKDILSIKHVVDSLKIKPVLFAIANSSKADRSQLQTNREFLSISQLKLLSKRGWTIGSHSYTHSDFSKLDSKGLEMQIVEAKTLLQNKLGKSIEYFAYPRGVYNKEIVAKVHKAKYKLGFSVDDGSINQTTNLLQVPRISIDREHSMAEFEVLFSPLVMEFKRMVKTNILGKIYIKLVYGGGQND